MKKILSLLIMLSFVGTAYAKRSQKNNGIDYPMKLRSSNFIVGQQFFLSGAQFAALPNGLISATLDKTENKMSNSSDSSKQITDGNIESMDLFFKGGVEKIHFAFGLQKNLNAYVFDNNPKDNSGGSTIFFDVEEDSISLLAAGTVAQNITIGGKLNIINLKHKTKFNFESSTEGAEPSTIKDSESASYREFEPSVVYRLSGTRLGISYLPKINISEDGYFINRPATTTLFFQTGSVSSFFAYLAHRQATKIDHTAANDVAVLVGYRGSESNSKSFGAMLKYKTKGHRSDKPEDEFEMPYTGIAATMKYRISKATVATGLFGLSYTKGEGELDDEKLKMDYKDIRLLASITHLLD